jgi:ribonuclease T2
LPETVKQDFAGLYPSDRLFDHEWPKHGTCSGLSPENYLSLSKQLKESVSIPERYQAPNDPFRTTVSDLQRDFTKSNPSIPADAITMICSGSGRFLQEIHVCFDKGGHATTCGSDVLKQMRSSCGQPSFLVKSVG